MRLRRNPRLLQTVSIAVLWFCLCTAPIVTAAEPADSRTRSGVQAFFDFSAGGSGVVKDLAGKASLHIADTNAVRLVNHALELHRNTILRSEKPAADLSAAIKVSNEITIEAWIRPGKTNQTGPARIITLSRDTSERNFTLGQDGNRYDIRFRTSKTSLSGTPSISSKPGSLTTDLTHVVYTRDGSGRARVYINGKINAEGSVPGDTSNWSGDMRLALGNELSNDRPWLGRFHLVALYSRALNSSEVERHFKAGSRPSQQPDALASAAPASESARLFQADVATLFARHCLECHDSASKNGKLDLSRKEAALAGTAKGRFITPGKAGESRVWKSVEADEMPDGRAPLSAKEKAALKRWIDTGAHWTSDFIDAAVYAQKRPANENWIRRLTVPEYIETVRSAVGVDIAKEARARLPRDLRVDGFANTAYNLGADLAHVEAYAALAETIVERMDIDAYVAQFSKSQKTGDIPAIVESMGKWILRGPLDAREVNTFVDVSKAVTASGGDFKQAIGFVVQAMLQSPRFVYRMERQRGDGTEWPVTGYELASRLSYILWGASPDKELMRAAEAGELENREKVRAQVNRMLKDPRMITTSERFFREWLDLDRLENLRPSKERFPNWDPRLAGDMRDETLTFFRKIVWEEKRPLSDLLNARVTFGSPRLAQFYGLKPVNDGTARYDLSSVPGRGGMLTHASILTVGGDDASMVTRGLFMLKELLRGVINDPPPCVDTTPVPTKPGVSQRMIAENRIANASCGGCHSRFEPLAFGFERFDGTGAYHEKDEHGNKLREDGEILIPGESQPVRYKTSAELMDLLAGSERVRETFTWKITQFALGRPLGPSDVPQVEKIHAAAKKHGGTYESVITAIVMSDLVQTIRTEAGK